MNATHIRARFLAAALLLALALAGCKSSEPSTSAMPSIAPPPSEEMEVSDQDNPGSLFNPGRADYLFSDNRARRVGDIVLINIVESSTATNEATTTTDKESTVDFGVTNFFDASSFGVGPFKGTVGDQKMIGASSSSEFEGAGSTERSSAVSATIAARVVDVLPGGLMQVEGAREVRVNEETQIMVVRGLVRPRDIDAANSVYSTHLANAQIEYYGKGVLADKQKPGWLTRILDNVWPF
jgi:flagellar L-ring protein precursor FlgH